MSDSGQQQGLRTPEQSAEPPDLLRVCGVTKSFPGVKALKGVDLHLKAGEILAVIGENGAGKSTLMKILAGVQEYDEGEVLVDGLTVRFKGVEDAFDKGIALIHQELNLADNLDVAANIFLGREPRKAGLLDKARMRRESSSFLDRVGLKVSPDQIVSDLTIGHQQMIEIAKALSVDARVLIMDEPTSSLSQHETEQLFKVIKDLASKNVAIVYISHRLSEVRELADRVTVLRDGDNAGELFRQETTHDNMVRLMVGRDISKYYALEPRSHGAVALKVDKVRTIQNPKHALSFEIKSGEIVGVAGLVGAGRTEMLQTLFGVMPALDGSMEVQGHSVVIRSPIQAIQNGLALVPEDRKQQGLVLEMAVRENMSLASLGRDQNKGFLNHRREQDISREMVAEMKIKTPSDLQEVQYLSGGNQQKVVLGKWLAMKPRVLFLDEPTRGIDVGAKQDIYKLMEKLAEEGVAILFVSSEMEEIIGMSDRAIVMHEGKLTGTLMRDELTEESVMQLATGTQAKPISNN
ncbi:MAG: sugar ABC transporter ATP-binding protein [Verrucomicrobia bacterium]|nr:sugar ABC transporter ATP-binding protein [Verrucomicrobiota bacterium]MBT4276642.1 sugar ABC transporter ATP-binding protein [Verrucomicrobiota bacterium]MBT5061019.1 sugar ABC transporter ATP-binding protein [Verrucomicrobiota bacterium]MBT5478360.1 sugar ABC transporter ATP-binding protein [Verrucomicrobiota bacterium]MBT6236810.1 sugar ABC transporter ATP-binding protein [Verrucomicrobiota bacterium]